MKRDTFKNMLMLTLAAVYIAGSCRVQAEPDSGINQEADKAFETKIEELASNGWVSFSEMTDLTGDGVHELFVEHKPEDMGGSGSLVEVYSYSEGDLDLLLTMGQYGFSECTYYHSTNTLELYGAGHGGEWYDYYRLGDHEYEDVAGRAREAEAGGSDHDGPWNYYSHGQDLTEEEFTALTSDLLKGESRTIGADDEAAAANPEAMRQADSEDADYILPGSDSRYLMPDEVKGMTKEELRLARNELYARKGRLFDNKELQEYFESKPWYDGYIAPDDFDDERIFNQYEIANRDLIMDYENR